MAIFLRLSHGNIVNVDNISAISYNESYTYGGSWGTGIVDENWDISFIGGKTIKTYDKQNIDKILNNVEIIQ